MEIQTRYVTSADGTRIAMSTLGQGRPLVHVLPIWLASMESNWQVPVLRDSYGRLAQRPMLVRFDHRDMGLSDHEVDDLSLDARVSDLSAVIDHFGAVEVDLLGSVTGGPVVIETNGTAIEGKLLGDGVLAVFASASGAIDCALRCGAAGDEAGLPLHLGIHAGDVIREEDNVYGGAVNIAARIAAASAPGELLVSDTVRSLARTSAGVDFEDLGEHALKGVADPQRLFAVRARRP